MAMRCQWVARRRDANLFVCIQRRGSIGSCPACRGAHACTRAAAERRRASQRAASRARRSPLSLSSVSRQLRICAFRWAISTRARGLRRGAPCSCGLGRQRGERTGAVRCSGWRRTAARPRSARARRAPHARRGASTVLEVGAVTRREGGLLPYLGGHGARSTAAQRGGGRHRRGSGRRRREGDAAARRARQAHHRAAQGARAHPRLGQQHAPLDAT